MKLSEAARIAWEAILKNKIRSFLTMLGIIIGVAAVIIMVAISAGTEATIQEQITSLGSNLIFVQGAMTRGGPGQAPTGGLVFDDAAAIQDGVNGVTSVVVEQNSSETVKYGDVLSKIFPSSAQPQAFPRYATWTLPTDVILPTRKSTANKKWLCLALPSQRNFSGKMIPSGRSSKSAVQR